MGTISERIDDSVFILENRGKASGRLAAGSRGRHEFDVGMIMMHIPKWRGVRNCIK
jgi:hypothetical protein